MSPRRLLAFLVVFAIGSLAVLAHASPPDPDWVSGFWDNGDYDNVVVMVTSGVGIADSHATDDTQPAETPGPIVSVSDENRLSSRPRLSTPTRAPPAV